MGVAKDHSVKEVAASAGVWKRTVIQVYQQWKKSQSTGNSSGLCQGRLPPNLAHLCSSLVEACLNIDVAYIQKLQSMPNQTTAVIGACGGIKRY